MSDKLIRRPQVQDKTGLSCSSIYAKMRPNPKRPGDFDPTFPRPISLGSQSVAWIEREVDAWIAMKIAASRRQEGGVT